MQSVLVVTAYIVHMYTYLKFMYATSSIENVYATSKHINYGFMFLAHNGTFT